MKTDRQINGQKDRWMDRKTDMRLTTLLKFVTSGSFFAFPDILSGTLHGNLFSAY